MRDSPQMLVLSLANSNTQLMLGLVAFLLTLCPLKNTQRCRNQKKKTWSRAVFSCLLSSQWKSVEALRFKRQREGGGSGGWGGVVGDDTGEGPHHRAALGVTGEGGPSGWKCHFDWNATKRQRSEGGNRRLISSLQAKSEPFQEIQGRQTGRTRSRPKKLLKKKKKIQKT